MQLNPKKIIGSLGRRYGGQRFLKVRQAYYDSIKALQDMSGTLFVLAGRKAPFSLDKKVDSLYNDREDIPQKKGVVLMLDGAIHHGGLTDRIRGILTAYREVKKRGEDFFIYWDHPFELTDFLQPASFDWRIRKDEISRSRKNSRAVVIDDMADSQSLLRLKAALRSHRDQLHLYTNADSARGEYHQLYNELFQPTTLLKNEVERHKRILGKGYWAFTTRFLTLLGDFNDWCDLILTEEEQLDLMEKVLEEFRKVAKDVPENTRILITSDSMKFLNFMRDKDPRIYIVEGEVEHIDLSSNRNDQTWLKTFTDQQLLMDADTVVRMRTGKMYASGFARFAAEVGKAIFIDHLF